MTNVVHIGDNSLWDSAAKHINKAISHAASSREEWLEAGRDLLKIRERYPSDPVFGQEVDKRGFNEFSTNHKRNAAMWLAELSEPARDNIFDTWPDITNPETLMKYAKREFGENYGLKFLAENPQEEETIATVVETAETEPKTPVIKEKPKKISVKNHNIKPRSYTKTPRIVKLIGKEYGDIIYSFLHGPACPGHKHLCDIAEHNAAGISAVRAFAKELMTGNYGTGHDKAINSISPRILFPDIPLSFSTKHALDKPTSSGLSRFIEKMPKLAEMVSELNGKMTEENCHSWWRANTGAAPSPDADATNVEIDHVALTQAAIAAQGGTFELLAETSEFTLHSVAERYTPLRDQNIIVCGQVLYEAGSEEPHIYRQLWSAYRLWEMFERNFRRLEEKGEDAVARGIEYRRLSAYADGLSAPGGRMLWKIGQAMVDHSDKINECSAASERGAYK